MTLLERFLQYVTIYTDSDPANEAVTPSSQRQFDLARVLESQLREMGASEVTLDEHCYVYATIPATPGLEGAPRLAFLSHMDTAPDFSGKDVKPQVIENYDGGDVVLGSSGRVLTVSEFPHLPSLKGRTLITSDGTTLLGADDKAGVAELMTLADILLSSDIPHGQVTLCFTPDEEIGNGVKCINMERLHSDYGYTLDGGPETEVVYENFNAAAADIRIKGRSIHPGEAKGLMVNAALVAFELNGMLPAGQTPSQTEEYEGFYHLGHIEGHTEEATMSYILRDHDKHFLEAKKQTLLHAAKVLNEKYGEGTVTVEIQDQYRNMAEMILPCMHLVENATSVIEGLGIRPNVSPSRGGTDGAALSFMGLPCPNLGTGGHAFHGPFEHVTLEGMENCVKIALGLVQRYAQ